MPSALLIISEGHKRGRDPREMTASKLSARQQMDNLTDFLVDDILEMSDEEVNAELIEQGLDPEKVADEMRAIFDKVLAATVAQ